MVDVDAVFKIRRGGTGDLEVQVCHARTGEVWTRSLKNGWTWRMLVRTWRDGTYVKITSSSSGTKRTLCAAVLFLIRFVEAEDFRQR